MNKQYSHSALPRHGVPMFISELDLNLDQDISLQKIEGESVKIVGRVVKIDPCTGQVILMEPGIQPRSKGHQSVLIVDTFLTDTDNFGVGTQVMVIGELEVRTDHMKDDAMDVDTAQVSSRSGRILLKARVARCVDRLDFSLYQQSVKQMRTLQKKTGGALAVSWL